ncbi:MAG TPA: xanthine dehydrogenase family protein subunit M [Ramlibacter sp.]|uniref:FAD binding domain-containing protein n=1 Tax=Ramlibacter sp. TaxID=1917967 RepID=UPI002BE3CD3B|nr:xanthine dehydrogenase family protein subunit M [Ramlibacter sp.]HVZ42202.1 xanthine dehydrogenase family protein subunit M [Ramlibacter sp.]
MKPGPFIYHTPRAMGELLALLASHQDDAAIIAGGQSLVPLLRFRLAQPQHVISLRGMASEFPAVVVDNGKLVIGACVTYAALQRSEAAAQACPALPAAIRLVATPAVRSRGTLCGNLCQADPASELPAVCLAMDAQLRLRSAGGERVLPAREFFIGPYTTARRPDEVLVAVEIARRPAAERFSIKEVTRLRGGFPMAGVAVALIPGAGDAVQSVAIACFGVHAVQLRIPEAEASLRRNGCTPRGVAQAADAIDAAVHPHGDAFASPAYRRAALRELFARAMGEVRGPAPEHA